MRCGSRSDISATDVDVLRYSRDRMVIRFRFDLLQPLVAKLTDVGMTLDGHTPVPIWYFAGIVDPTQV